MAVNFTISAVIKAVDKITAPVAKMTARISALTAPLKRVGMGLKAFSDRTGITKLTTGIIKFTAALVQAAIKTALLGGALLTLAGVGAAAILLNLTKGFSEAGDEAATTAKKLGVTTQELQKMRFAADMLDVESETLDGGLKKLSRSITMASKGAKDQVKAFKLLGYTDKQIRAGKISVMDATTRLATRMEDEKKAKSNAIIANALYGKSYLELMPMLKEGGEKIAELAAEAEKLGLVMSDDAVKAAGDFDDATKRLNYSFEGLRNSIGAQILPLLTPLVDKLREWVSANRELIAEKVKEYLDKILTATKQLYDFLQSVDWKAVGDDLTNIAKAFGSIATAINSVVEGMGKVRQLFKDSNMGYGLSSGLAAGIVRSNAMDAARAKGGTAPTNGAPRTGATLAGEAAAAAAKADVTVTFQNTPTGTRVDSKTSGAPMSLGVDVGHQTGGAF